MLRARLALPCAILLLAAIAVCSDAFPAQPAATYQFIKEIPVPGDGGWDYLSIDVDARRLYAAHSDHIDVIDIDHNKVIGTIADTPGVHGFALAHELGRGFASDGETSQISIIDLKTLATISRITTGTGPDAIVFESRRNEVYSFNGRGNSSTVIDARNGKLIATIALPGKPEFAAVDPETDRVFVNIEDKNLIVAIDATSHKIAGLWQIAPCDSPSGLAIDTAHHRLFVGCRNQRMLMVDAQIGRVVTSVPIGKSVDANAYDPQLQLAFSSNGEGTVTVAHEATPETMTVVQTLQTQTGARTMALDAMTHNIYLATADRVQPPAGSAASSRPAIVPGSFRILVYGPGAH